MYLGAARQPFYLLVFLLTMSEVANELAATGIEGFIQRLYKPIYLWAKNTFATKEDISGSNVSIVDQSTAEAVWGDYTFSTSD